MSSYNKIRDNENKNIKKHKKIVSKEIKLRKKYNLKDLHIDRDNTLWILDWDDTICPTSWMVQNEVDLTCPKSRKNNHRYFQDLDTILYNFLRKMLMMGKVIIITNAMPEWVELSCSVLPNTMELLSEIDVISARKRYQNKEKSSEWKRLTFKEELEARLQDNHYVNIISLGDAEYEYIALKDLYRWKRIPHKYLKSIRFIRSPDHRTLLEQIQMIRKNLTYIHSSTRHLDLEFDKK